MGTVKLIDLFESNISGEWGSEPYGNENDVEIIRSTNFSDDIRFKTGSEIVTRNVESSKLDSKRLQYGDIIVEKSGGSPTQPVGRILYYDFNDQITRMCNNFTSILRPTDNNDSKYLAYLLLSLYQRRAVLKFQNKTTGIINLKLKDYLESTRVSIPPLETQKKIVEALDKAQALIDARKEQIRLMDELVKSRFVEMFGDPVQNPMRWETKMLSELGNCKNGMNFSADEQGVELKYLGVGDFKNNSKIEDVKELGTISLNQAPSDEYLLQNGDIVFVRSNGNKALVGRSLAVYPNGTPTTFSGFCIRFRKNNKLIEIPYLLQALKSNSMRMLMCGRGANIQNLNQQILGNLIIPIPPTSLQLHYSEFMRKTEINRLKMQYSFDEINIVYQSLMQQYFE